MTESMIVTASGKKTSHVNAVAMSPRQVRYSAYKQQDHSRSPLYEWLDVPDSCLPGMEGLNRTGPYKFYMDFDKVVDHANDDISIEVTKRWEENAVVIVKKAIAHASRKSKEPSDDYLCYVSSVGVGVIEDEDSPHNGKTKISMHVVFPRVLASQSTMKKALQWADWEGLDRDYAPDKKVYKTSQKLRLPLFIKSQTDHRVLVPGPRTDYYDHIVSYINHNDNLEIEVADMPRGRPPGRNARRNEEREDDDVRAVLMLAKSCGFPAPVLAARKANEAGPSFYEFQDTEAMKACPLCGGEHDSTNNYVIKVTGRSCYLTRHSDSCADVPVDNFVSEPTKIVVNAFMGDIDLPHYHALAIIRRFEEAGMRYMVLRDNDKVQWYKWQNSHWREDSSTLDADIRAVCGPGTGYASDRAIASALRKLCASEEERPYVCTVMKVCAAKLSYPELSTVKKELASLLTLPKAKEEVFDRHDRLLHFTNGYLDLDDYDETRGKYVFHVPDPSKLNSRFVPFDYLEDYDEGRMEELKKVIALWVPDEPCREFMLKYMATTLSGDQDIKAFAVFTDSVDTTSGHVGSNGKSRCVKYLARTLGHEDTGYACPLNSSTFEKSSTKQANAHTADIGRVPGRRMVYVDEMSKDQQLAKDSIKNWTSGTRDLISVREPYKIQGFMRWRAKIFFACNNMQFPRFEDDPALTARMVMIPFENKFVSDEAVLAEDRARVVSNPGHRVTTFPMDPFVDDKLDAMRLEFIHLLLGYFRGRDAFVKEVTGRKPPKMEFYINYLQLDNHESMHEFLNSRLERFDPPANLRHSGRQSLTLAQLTNAWKEHSGAKGINRQVQAGYVRSCLATWLRARGLDPGRVMRVRDTSEPATDQTKPARVSVVGFKFAEGGGGDEDRHEIEDSQMFLGDLMDAGNMGEGPSTRRQRTE